MKVVKRRRKKPEPEPLPTPTSLYGAPPPEPPQSLYGAPPLPAAEPPQSLYGAPEAPELPTYEKAADDIEPIWDADVIENEEEEEIKPAKIYFEQPTIGKNHALN